MATNDFSLPHDPRMSIRRFQASDAYPLHYRHWQPDCDVLRGRIVALHGIQSHSGWYEYSSRRLCDAGFQVNFIDRRGSGLNGRARGSAPSAERLINDVIQFLNHIEEPASPVPTTLLSVSWGGKPAVAVASRRPDLINGLALLYPGICSHIKPRWYQRIQLNLAETFDVRDRRVPIPLSDPALFTDQPHWQEFIRDDPLALHEVTVEFLRANLTLDRLLERAPGQVNCRVLLMLAGRDRIIDNERTKSYYARFASNDKKLIEYPQAAHTLEFDSNRDTVVQDLLNWLSAGTT